MNTYIFSPFLLFISTPQRLVFFKNTTANLGINLDVIKYALMDMKMLTNNGKFISASTPALSLMFVFNYLIKILWNHVITDTGISHYFCSDVAG